MSEQEEQIESVEVSPEVSPMSRRHEHKPHARLPMIDRLTMDRVNECEVKLVDPNVEICHNPPSHIVRELSIVVCANHTAAIESIHAEQVNALAKEQEEYEKKSKESESAPGQSVGIFGNSIQLPSVPGAPAAQ